VNNTWRDDKKKSAEPNIDVHNLFYLENELSAIELFIAFIIVLFLNQDIGLNWLMKSTKGRIVWENPSSILGLNNSWSDLTYLMAELRNTMAPFL
jgi:hypothetical protein